MNNKRIITCAITGSIHTPSMSDYLPITPKQIAESALGAAEAGAAIVHIHARNPENGIPTPDLELFREIMVRIRAVNQNVIICITTGGGPGMSVEQRAAVIPEFKPELASCNLGSINWGMFPLLDRMKEFKFEWEPVLLEMSKGIIFQNTFADLMQITGIMKEHGTKPEFEVYDVGHLYNCGYLLQAGYVKPPVHLQFVTGILGGIQATPYDLMTLHNTAERVLGGANYTWSVIGAGKQQFPICTMGLILGGHVRVGLEDNLYLSRGVKAKNNAEQVTKIARIMNELDLVPATPQEAREMLGLSGMDDEA